MHGFVPEKGERQNDSHQVASELCRLFAGELGRRVSVIAVWVAAAVYELVVLPRVLVGFGRGQPRFWICAHIVLGCFKEGPDNLTCACDSWSNGVSEERVARRNRGFVIAFDRGTAVEWEDPLCRLGDRFGPKNKAERV